MFIYFSLIPINVPISEFHFLVPKYNYHSLYFSSTLTNLTRIACYNILGIASKNKWCDASILAVHSVSALAFIALIPLLRGLQLFTFVKALRSLVDQYKHDYIRISLFSTFIN